MCSDNGSSEETSAAYEVLLEELGSDELNVSRVDLVNQTVYRFSELVPFESLSVCRRGV